MEKLGWKVKGPGERDIRNNPLEFDCREVVILLSENWRKMTRRLSDA